MGNNDAITNLNEVDPSQGHTICEFDGLEIRMFLDVWPGHFLVYGDGKVTVYRLDGVFIAGDKLDSKIDNIIKRWCKKNLPKLALGWASCCGGNKPSTIAPPGLSRRAQKRRARKKLF